MYLKFQADQIFTGHNLLSAEQVLIATQDGLIKEIIHVNDAGDDVQQFEGIITPGHINCHCHLELSHMKGQIPPGTGLTGFISAVMQSKPSASEEKLQAMKWASDEMYSAGISVVGDISNHALSLEQKRNSHLYWHNFLEISNLDDAKAEAKLNSFEEIKSQFLPYIPATVLAPHAVYSVSPATFRMINEATRNQIITIHNQETAAEDELFISGSGLFLDFYAAIGRKQLPVNISGKSSLMTWLPYFDNGQTILLVHNTFINEADLVFALNYAQEKGLKLVFCLCPNANLYIEGKLPPFDLLMKYNCQIVLGTDSLASNWQLSIVQEAYRFRHQVGINLSELLKWMTFNGAAALGVADRFGSLTSGTRPGIALVSNEFCSSRRLL